MRSQSASNKVVVRLAYGRVVVDVTDLFLLDFDIADELANSIQAITDNEKSTSVRGRIVEAEQALCSVLDKVAGRMIEVCRRLTLSENAGNPPQGVDIEWRHRRSALSRAELVELGVFKRDVFANMELDELRSAVGEPQWTELQLRLTVAQPLDAKYMRRAAQWFLRGLDVQHAVVKACMATRRHPQ